MDTARIDAAFHVEVAHKRPHFRNPVAHRIIDIVVGRSKARGGTVVVECQSPMAKLLQNCSGIDQIVVSGQALPHYDWHIFLMSLPHVFQTTLETIPSRVPYLNLKPPSHRAQKTSDRRVGLAWAGNPKQQRDRMRSCRFKDLMPLFKVPGVQWVCLQKEISFIDRDSVAACHRLEHVRVDDFSDTAEQISMLDLVISVDTSVAHLAGALNVPVWILLAKAIDWRWLMDRDDSPWYPSAHRSDRNEPTIGRKLFKQSARN